MTIKEITDEKIVFDNGTEITYYHCQGCCENVYADFEGLKKSPSAHLWDGENFRKEIEIEPVPNAGFRFGYDGMWVFVACYNVQNGYYGDDLEIIVTYPDGTIKKTDISDGVQDFD